MVIRPLHKAIIFTIFTLSGFIALVYEILWSKYLSLTFGTSIVAVSIVTATFMGGLALGSYLLGKYADISKNLLRIYAYLELGIAVFALLFPPTLKIVEYGHTIIEHLFPQHLFFASAIHFIFSTILLIPPTLLMGGTFPVMCRLFARKKLSGEIGILYAINTFGATLGALSAGFFIIPALGLSGTGFLSVACNLVIAVIAYSLSKHMTPVLETSEIDRSERVGRNLRGTRLILTATALTGAFSLACEILWTRTFLLFLGNTTYAFSLILSAYLIGIAFGGTLFARKIRHDTELHRLFVILTALSGISIILTVPFYDLLPFVFQMAHELSNGSWYTLSGISFITTISIMLLPTIFAGALFPSAVAIMSPNRSRTGEGVGIVVFFNTMGALVGSLTACFVLIPLLGLLQSFRLIGALSIVFSLVLLFHYRLRIPSWKPLGTVFSLSLLLLLIPASWDQLLMNSGIYRYAHIYTDGGGLRKVLSHERIIDVIEGTDTTVAVHESLDGKQRFFTVNGKTDGSTMVDMDTQLLVSHIPMILHPDPEKVLVIGLGTGVSLKGLVHYGSETIDCVEISREVFRAYDYFADYSGYPLADPKINLFIEDGRNHLLTIEDRYDVIVSEPSNPWQAGNANLFTDDFYKIASDKLTDNGLFCQWVGIYDITPENLRTVVKTFLNTFPNTLAFSADTDLILLGAKSPLSFDYLGMKQKFDSPGIRKTLSEIGVTSPGDLLAKHYMSTDKALQLFAGDAELNTDDNSILEFSARDLIASRNFGINQMKNLNALLSSIDRAVIPLKNLGYTAADVAEALRELGDGYERDGKTDQARQFAAKAREILNLPFPKG